MGGKVAIVAALPREIAGLVRGVKPEASLVGGGVYLYRLPHAVVVAAGMGAVRASLAVGAALAAGGVTMLVSAGLAGACAAGIAAGSVVEADVVIDVKTGERFEAAPVNGGAERVVLATTDEIASVREKARLLEAYGARLVDMEAATVARLARANGLAFRAIKGVSDEHDFELLSLARFEGKRGSFRTGAFALHTALRPMEWAKTVRLGRDSSRALAGLTAALQDLIDGM